MRKHKFKAGDRVQLLRESIAIGEEGDTGSIVHAASDFTYLIKYDRNIVDSFGHSADKWWAEEYDLAYESSKTLPMPDDRSYYALVSGEDS